ncbi:MAG: hypothetical protein P3W89_002925, partial [Aquificaceae bacterium]|nr:hypothetical protein [Aquificaceae bacterium]
PWRVSEPQEGTSLGIRFNPWQVLKVVVLLALSPEKVLRDLSVLKEILFQGLWGDPRLEQVHSSGCGGGGLCESTGYF